MKGFVWKAGNLAGIATDSARFALSELKVDKFRTILSLAGVSIGIFSIVSVFTLVDSLKESLDQGLEEFGKDVTFVEQMPLEPDLNEEGIFRWWEYVSRPQVTYDEYLFLAQHNSTFSQMCWTCFLDDGTTVGITPGWEMTIRNRIVSGRPFSAGELQYGAPVAIAGADYAKLHKTDSIVTLDGVRCTIIGTLERSGLNSVSLADTDKSIMIPARLAMRLNSFNGCRTSLAIKPAEGISDETFTAEIRALMRRYRRLSPQAKDNFSVNRLSFIVNEMENLFALVDSIGWIIGIFSLLVGGFGIANIMFVSVRERTAQIGLQMALGAKRRIIVLQYLTESVTLSVMGGAAGLAVVWLATLLLYRSPLPVSLSPGNAATGMLIAAIIGIAAGVAPATAAANLHPAEALLRE